MAQDRIQKAAEQWVSEILKGGPGSGQRGHTTSDSTPPRQVDSGRYQGRTIIGHTTTEGDTVCKECAKNEKLDGVLTDDGFPDGFTCASCGNEVSADGTVAKAFFTKGGPGSGRRPSAYTTGDIQMSASMQPHAIQYAQNTDDLKEAAEESARLADICKGNEDELFQRALATNGQAGIDLGSASALFGHAAKLHSLASQLANSAAQKYEDGDEEGADQDYEDAISNAEKAMETTDKAIASLVKADPSEMPEQWEGGVPSDYAKSKVRKGGPGSGRRPEGGYNGSQYVSEGNQAYEARILADAVKDGSANHFTAEAQHRNIARACEGASKMAADVGLKRIANAYMKAALAHREAAASHINSLVVVNSKADPVSASEKAALASQKADELNYA
jgi:hypothetical protein